MTNLLQYTQRPDHHELYLFLILVAAIIFLISAPSFGIFVSKGKVLNINDRVFIEKTGKIGYISEINGEFYVVNDRVYTKNELNLFATKNEN